ncbi:hypothetical protein OF83DRAFT_1172287 [Amylostereum chailletii]|nr:hypothetical protein OF83DRAFT_1172287 [Amylostereum chailletii]
MSGLRMHQLSSTTMFKIFEKHRDIPSPFSDGALRMPINRWPGHGLQSGDPLYPASRFRRLSTRSEELSTMALSSPPTSTPKEEHVLSEETLTPLQVLDAAASKSRDTALRWNGITLMLKVFCIVAVPLVLWMSALHVNHCQPQNLLRAMGIILQRVYPPYTSYPGDLSVSAKPLGPSIPPYSSPDFASRAYGGIVIPQWTTVSLGQSALPHNVLEPAIPDGSCWSLPTISGLLGISFDRPILPIEITIIHSPTIPIDQAPRTVVIWGLLDGDENIQQMQPFRSVIQRLKDRLSPPPASPAYNSAIQRLKLTLPASDADQIGALVPLTAFEFDPKPGALYQRFPFHGVVLEWGLDWTSVVVQIHDNWGANLTSLCQVEIRGRPVHTS